MAPPKKTKESTKRSVTMASKYEQEREENIRRNQEKMSILLLQQKSSDLSSLLGTPKKPTKKISKKLIKSPITSPRRSLRARGLPPNSTSTSSPPSTPPQIPTGQFSFSDAVKMFENPEPYGPLVKTIRSMEERIENRPDMDSNLDPRTNLELKKENVRKIFGERIMVLKFLPVSDREIIVSGNKQGFLGFWDVSSQKGDNDAEDVFVFLPHRSPVSGISFHPNSIKKIYSSSYEGNLCLMDIEKEMFDTIYSSDYAIFSLCQSPNNHNLLYLGQAGQVNSFDEREKNKICNTWELHENRINTIDFHPQNSNLFLTSSTDGFTRIWDLRILNKKNFGSIKEMKHNRAVHSAYFSPTGTSFVSTSVDDTIKISSGSNFDNVSTINHNNQTGRWLSSFRAIWGWNDSNVLIGNMERAIDVISTNDSVITPIQSEYMTNIPCRFAINPYKEGHLACAGGGKLYLWTQCEI